MIFPLRLTVHIAGFLYSFPFSLIYLGSWLLTFTLSSELRWSPNMETDLSCSCHVSPGTTCRTQSKRTHSLEVYKRCLALRAFPVTDKVLKHPLFSWLLLGHECPWQMATAIGGWIWRVGETEKDFSLVGAWLFASCSVSRNQQPRRRCLVPVRVQTSTTGSTFLHQCVHIVSNGCTVS